MQRLTLSSHAHLQPFGTTLGSQREQAPQPANKSTLILFTPCAHHTSEHSSCEAFSACRLVVPDPMTPQPTRPTHTSTSGGSRQTESTVASARKSSFVRFPMPDPAVCGPASALSGPADARWRVLYLFSQGKLFTLTLSYICTQSTLDSTTGKTRATVGRQYMLPEHCVRLLCVYKQPETGR